MEFYPDYLLRLLLVFARVSALLVAAPFFNNRSIPVRVKVLLGSIVALLLVAVTPLTLPAHATNPVGLIAYLVMEVLTGLLIGFAAQFVFFALQFASEIIGFQIGLSLAQVYNPIDGSSANPLGQLLTFVMVLVFLLLDGHHTVVRALAFSFEAVPLAGGKVHASGPLLLTWMGQVFITAIQLASPFMITIFLVDASLGIFARLVPQAELFQLSLPIKLMGGFVLTILFMPNLFPLFPTFFSRLRDDLYALLEALAFGLP
ncbi:MAG: flagellar biosynthetic protein FliR [Bacteroidota bacterium]